MRRLFMSGVFAVVSLTAPFAIPNAQAMTIPAPAALAGVAHETSPLEDVAVACRRVWQCGPYGCGWRRQCWDSGYGYGGGGYGYGGPVYGGRRWRTWNGCPPNFTIQDGVCKPYRGY
jgi:hypothetical protein